MVKRSIWNVMSSVFGTHQDTDIEIIDILYMKLTRKERKWLKGQYGML